MKEKQIGDINEETFEKKISIISLNFEFEQIWSFVKFFERMKMTSFRNMNTLTFLYFIRKSYSDNILYDICIFYKNDILCITI